MKKITKNNYYIIMGTILILTSLVLHSIHYLVFKDLHHIMVFLIEDIAFIPLEVFFVTLVLDKFLESREKKHLLKKLNMLVGLFYSEFGLDIFQEFVNADEGIDELMGFCEVKYQWEDKDFAKVQDLLLSHKHKISIGKIDLLRLKGFLDTHKGLLLNLIANPNLLEHESFSELLMSIFHLQEELSMREIYSDHKLVDKHDLDHLTVDIERVYKHISLEWVKYMKHLKEEYPYLFLTAGIRNPYDNRVNKNIEKEILESIYASRIG